MPRQTPSSRPLALMPLFFDLQGRECLVTGDEQAAMAAKARLLAMAGARVCICTAGAESDFTALADGAADGFDVRFISQPWRELDLKVFALAIGAFEELPAAERFYRAARLARVPVNLVDRPSLCDFQVPSIVNRSPLIVGISTGGAAPVFGQWLRGRLESLLPQGTGRVLRAARALRGKIGKTIRNPAAKRKFWRKMAEDDLGELARMPPREIEKHLLRNMEKLAAGDDGKAVLWLAGVPARPEDMSLKTLRLLQNADVVFISTGLDDGYAGFARRDAELVSFASEDDLAKKAAGHVAAGGMLVSLHEQVQIPKALAKMDIDCRII